MMTRWLCATFLFGVAVTACKDDPPPTKEAAPTATAPEPEAKIKSVFTADPSATSTAPAGQAPPPNGVFGPGEADKAHPPGAPATVEVIDKGAEPRQVLRPGGLSDKETVQVLIGLRGGGAVFPNVVYTLELAKPKAGKDEAKEEGEPTGPEPLSMTIKAVALAKEQPGQLPPDLDKEIQKVKGSRIETKVLPSGALLGTQISYGEEMKDQALRPLVDSIGDVMSYFFSPYPEEPIGKGGYWISHDRLSIQGLELVRYRVTKVEEMKGDELLLSVQLRHYLAGGDISALVGKDQPGIVAGAFDSTGQAQLTRKQKGLVPITGEMRSPYTIVITMANNPQAQAQPVQFEVHSRLMPVEKKEGE